MSRPLSPDEISAILRTTERQAAHPSPVTMASVGAQVAQAMLVGLGAVMLLGGGLWLLQAPAGVLMQIPLTVGVIAAGIRLVLAIIPSDNIAMLRHMRRFKATADDAIARKHAAYRAIEELEAQHTAEVQQWQHALTELRNENKTLRAQLNRHQEERRSPNFTPKSNVASEVVGDATKILEHWFSTLTAPDASGHRRGEWWSRPKAMSAGWTKTRHEAATTLLDDAGITGTNGRLTFVVQDLGTLDAALFALNKYCSEAATEPEMPRRQDSYVEPDFS